MKRLILHVGTHKTGTTALQGFLLDNADHLAQAGIAFPLMPARAAGIKAGRNGNFLRWHAFMDTRPDDVTDERRMQTALNVDAFLDAAQAAQTVVLSEEYLWYDAAQDPRYWDVLSDLFRLAGFERVDALVYLRRQDLFVASLWNQKVKDDTKVRCTLSEYVRRPAVASAMDYDAGVRALERAFGRERVSVRVFDRAELVGGDIRRDFCEAMGMDRVPGLVFGDNPSNPGLTTSIAEVKRQANHAPEYREAGNFLRKSAVSVSALDCDRGNVSRLSADEARAILAQHAEGNARIARDYLGRDELFAPYVPSPSDGAGEGAAEAEVDPTLLARDAIRLYADALAREHVQRVELERRVKDLEKRVDGLNASLGVLARLRRKRWRSASKS